MKRIIALLLAMLFAVTALAACGEKTGSSSKSDSTSAPATQKATEEETEAEPVAAGGSLDNAAYVMIYNPAVYDSKKSSNPKLTTGDLSAFIDTDISRAESVKEPVKMFTISQGAMNNDDIEIDFSSDRAGYVPPVYKTGDKQDFYGQKFSASGAPMTEKFTCVYEGDHCYAWFPSDKNPNLDQVKSFVKEFDELIYPTDVKLFGEPRFSEEKSKISIVIQSMYENDGLGGYFWCYELCTPSEVSSALAAQYGINVGIPMLHINEIMFEDNAYRTELLRTIAHEFQHLINFSDVFYTVNSERLKTIEEKIQPVWINEAMSGYAEEKTYPNEISVFNKYYLYAESARIRTGQSLYNFGSSLDPNAPDRMDSDYGVYGSVYNFTEYLTENNDDNIFSEIHNYWRTSYEPSLMDSDALYNSVSDSFRKEIDGKFNYPSDWQFESEDKEWMSKMTLDFYIYMMQKDVPLYSGIENDTSMKPEELKTMIKNYTFYGEVNPAQIEGGGRIVFATKEGKYEIPADASKQLIYIGFDKNFNQTGMIVS